ncbi:MAG: ABC transporter ATP-binding protein [Acidimicrobiales bacterium]
MTSVLPPDDRSGSPAVEARELYRFFHTGDDEVLALRGVSLVVGAGEFVAVMGPSGSGKSTLLSCMSGLDEPDGGTVRIAGRAMSRRPERERAALRARHVGVVLQSANLVDHLRLAANLRVAHRLSGDRGHPDVEDVLERVGLPGRQGAYPAQLSGGEAVRAGLAVALVNRPAVVIADEPTAEVDRATEERLLDLLRAEVERGTALVVATHSPVVAAAADRVVTIADGRIVS